MLARAGTGPGRGSVPSEMSRSAPSRSLRSLVSGPTSLRQFHPSRAGSCLSASPNAIVRPFSTILLPAFIPTSLLASAPLRPRPVVHITPQTRGKVYAGLRPAKMKHKKRQRGFFPQRPHSLRATTLDHGNWGIRVTEGGRLKDKQVDAMRTVVKRVLKGEKGSKVWMRCFTERPVTKKAAETRMGKGKGAVEYFATWVPKGRVVLEVQCDRQDIAMKALRAAGSTLPLRTEFISLPPGAKHERGARCLPYFIMKKIHDEHKREVLEKREKALKIVRRGVVVSVSGDGSADARSLGRKRNVVAPKNDAAV
ncbi:mitochondrial ribosomal large subunit component [Irineochytrium annulatum]|nr:mitochondrial ribosomal large subunit component [Irineochytrium annulatum]